MHVKPTTAKRLCGSAAVVLMLLAVFAFIRGCSCSEVEPPPPSPAVKPLAFKEWPEPALAIVLSGEQHGFLEPCGCTAENQIGGLGHRDHLLRMLHEQQEWAVAAFDLGGMIHRRGPNREQDKYKLAETLAALREMGYGGVTLGPEELKFPTVDFLLSLRNLDAEADTAEEKDASPPFVSANVSVLGLGPRKYQLVDAGGLRVGVTGVMGEKQFRSAVPAGANLGIEFMPPEQALPAVLEALRGQEPDLLLLLAHTSLEEAESLARRFPQFDVVQSAGGPEDGIGSRHIGETLLVNVGMKGKHVGVVGFYPDGVQPDGDSSRVAPRSQAELGNEASDARGAGEPSVQAPTRFRFELVDLDRHRFDETERMRTHMQQYQDAIKSHIHEIFIDIGSAEHPSGSTFVGVESCARCHTKAYAKWKTTRHSHAYQSLIEGREHQENPVPRNLDPECLACHVTGWRPQAVMPYKSGFLPLAVADSPRVNDPSRYHVLKGQQCENCHGPGSRHVELETAWKNDPGSVPEAELAAERNRLRMTEAQAKDPRNARSCYRCHDIDNSPNFDFQTYWPKVRHPGKD